MTLLDTISEMTFTNEAEVENRLIIPLLDLLGYTNNDIRPKYPVVFREGRQGRNPEADFVVFAGPEHSRNTSLLVVEAKHPNESISDAKGQGESYAANLRAPFLLVTNGRNLELWQLQASFDSDCVFSSPVKDLPGRFEELHRLVWKEAATEHKGSLRQRSIADVANDFGKYLDSELRRTNEYPRAIVRRLNPVASAGQNTIASDRLLDDLPAGAAVIASSGYGKTTLANDLARQCADKSKSNGSSVLPFYIMLPDAAAQNRSLLEYAQERLAAHCAQVSTPAFRYLLRSVGGILLLDGFDRLSPGARHVFSAEINTLRRDYGALGIFIFSRASSRPDVGLPLLALAEYSNDEQLEYAKLFAAQKGQPFGAPIGSMPETLRTICKVPLLLQLALQYWHERQVFPPDLKALFQSWIDHLLQTTDAPASQAIKREEALRLIASETTHGILDARAAINVLHQNGYPETVLDELIQSDAVRRLGSSLELVHEALGDYLRASHLAQTDSTALIHELATVQLDMDSLFPVLLGASLERHGLQQALFRRLARLDLPTYFDALRYRADTSAEVLADEPEAFVRSYLEDMIEGIEEPLSAFFPRTKTEIIRSLTNARASEHMSVLGNGSPAWVNYLYVPGVSGQKVKVGPFGSETHIRGSNLSALGLRADSGRLLGLRQLEEELLGLPARRVLAGGVEWTSERLIGRLRFLINRRGMALDLHGSLDAFETFLRPHADKVVLPDFGRKVGFSIESVLSDIGLLRARGDTHLNLWWEGHCTDDKFLHDEARTRAAQ